MLFNIALDSLLKGIEKTCYNEGFPYYAGGIEKRAVVQAYADDVVLIAGSKKGLQDMLDMVGLFGRFTGIRPAQGKCVTFSITREFGRTAADMDHFNIDGIQIPNLHNGETFRYLGVPIGGRKTARLKGSEIQLEKVVRLARRIEESGLKLS